MAIDFGFGLVWDVFGRGVERGAGRGEGVLGGVSGGAEEDGLTGAVGADELGGVRVEKLEVGLSDGEEVKVYSLADFAKLSG